MTIKVRKAGSEDMPFLREMFYEAILIPSKMGRLWALPGGL